MELRPGYKRTEVGTIPEDWDALELGSDISLVSGHHVLARFCNSDFGTPYITGPSDFSSGVIKHTKFTTRPSAICNPRDILITVKGSGVGSMVVADSEYCISRQLMAIRPKSWSGEFVYFSLLQNSSAIAAASTGLIPGLSRSDIIEQKLPVPPIPEQHAIAAALRDVDAFLLKLDQLIGKKYDLKRAAMQQLLTGKTRLPGFDGEWEERRLEEIGESLIGLTYSPEDVRDHGTLVLRSSNVQNGALAFHDNVFVSMDIPERALVKVGDVLICARNGSRDLIGKAALLDERTEGMAFGAFMAVFRSPIGRLINFLFQSEILKKQINEHLGATINQITNKSLNSFKIPLAPTKPEQDAIASVLSDMDAELAALQSRREKTRAMKKAMMQQLLTGNTRLPITEPADV